MKDYKARSGPKGRKPAKKNPSASGLGLSGRFGRPGLGNSHPVTEADRSWPIRLLHGIASSIGLSSLRKFHRGHLLLLAWSLCAGWLAMGLIAGGVALWRSPLESVMLEGNQRLEGQALLKLGGLRVGLDMRRADPFDVARSIVAHPHIATADVRRLYPGRLMIRIRERVPQFEVRLESGKTAIVDGDSVVLSLFEAGKRAEGKSSGLPLVGGVEEKGVIGKALTSPVLARARRIFGVMERIGFSEMGRVEVNGKMPFQSQVTFPGGQRLLLPEKGMEQAIQLFRRLITGNPELFEGKAVIDLSGVTEGSRGRIVLSPRLPNKR